jgi:hypothetical protein
MRILFIRNYSKFVRKNAEGKEEVKYGGMEKSNTGNGEVKYGERRSQIRGNGEVKYGGMERIHRIVLK